MDMPDTIGGHVLAFALESNQPGVRADVRRLVSFKLVADELHVTSSAVSHTVAALEEFLGVKLFHRRVRRLLLTDAGSAYLAPLTRAFDAISAATREISARNRADVVTLASMPTFARVWLIDRKSVV